MNVDYWGGTPTTLAHIYVYDGSGTLLGGTHTNAGAGFSNAGGTGTELTAAISPGIPVTSSATYIIVWQGNGGSDFRPRVNPSTPNIQGRGNAVASFTLGSPPQTLPSPGSYDITPAHEFWTWLDGSVGGSVVATPYSRTQFFVTDQVVQF